MELGPLILFKISHVLLLNRKTLEWRPPACWLACRELILLAAQDSSLSGGVDVEELLGDMQDLPSQQPDPAAAQQGKVIRRARPRN